MSKIIVEGEECLITDNLGFQNGYYVKMVRRLNGKDCAVVKLPLSSWRFWTGVDKLSGGCLGQVVGQVNKSKN